MIEWLLTEISFFFWLRRTMHKSRGGRYWPIHQAGGYWLKEARTSRWVSYDGPHPGNVLERVYQPRPGARESEYAVEMREAWDRIEAEALGTYQNAVNVKVSETSYASTVQRYDTQFRKAAQFKNVSH